MSSSELIDFIPLFYLLPALLLVVILLILLIKKGLLFSNGLSKAQRSDFLKTTDLQSFNSKTDFQCDTGPFIHHPPKNPSSLLSLNELKRDPKPFRPLIEPSWEKSIPSEGAGSLLTVCATPRHSTETLKSKDDKDGYQSLRDCTRVVEQYFLPSKKSKNWLASSSSKLDQLSFTKCFSSENEAMVMLYDLKNEKVVFVSHHVKEWFGLSPIEFRNKFEELLVHPFIWRELSHRLNWYSETKQTVLMKENSVRTAWKVLLSKLSYGKQNYAVGLWFPANKKSLEVSS